MCEVYLGSVATCPTQRNTMFNGTPNIRQGGPQKSKPLTIIVWKTANEDSFFPRQICV